MNSMLLAFAALEPRLATDCRLLSLRRHERAVRIGVHDFERSGPQRLWFDVDLCVRLERAAAARDDIADTLNYKAVSKRLVEFVGQSDFGLVETLAERCAAIVIEEFNVPWLRLKLSKPGAVRGAQSVGVIIERTALAKGN